MIITNYQRLLKFIQFVSDRLDKFHIFINLFSNMTITKDQ